MNSSALIGGKFILKNPLQDFLSSLNAVISTNESTRFITGHVIFNLAYTYKFQLKTAKDIESTKQFMIGKYGSEAFLEKSLDTLEIGCDASKLQNILIFFASSPWISRMSQNFMITLISSQKSLPPNISASSVCNLISFQFWF